MLPIHCREGKPYIGDLEVEITPAYLGVEVTLESEKGTSLPPPETLVVNAVTGVYKKLKVNLFEKANSYRGFLVARQEIPEMYVPDGNVPPRDMFKFIVDFYKARPVKSPKELSE